MPEVTFSVAPEFEWMQKPTKASKFIPAWYKSLDRYVMPEKDDAEIPIGTAKICSPFQDALTAGYIVPLPFKVFANVLEDGTVNFSWKMPEGITFAMIDVHGPLQLKGMGLEEGGVFKFCTPWVITLEEGYSALYTHPLNRPELPFQSFSAVVDSDSYKSPVNFPFMWTGTPGLHVIDAGTPIAQVIPFKREDWTSKINVSSEAEIAKDARIAVGHVEGYRRLYRRPKSFN